MTAKDKDTGVVPTPAKSANLRFDSMLDALTESDDAAAFEYGSSAASKQDFVRQTLTLIEHSLRQGAPSQRMMDLLANYITEITVPDGLRLLGFVSKGRPNSEFRKRVAVDAFIAVCAYPNDPMHPDAGNPDDPDNKKAMIAAYDAYFYGEAEARTYAKDNSKGEKARKTMKSVIKPLLHAAGVLKPAPFTHTKSGD